MLKKIAAVCYLAIFFLCVIALAMGVDLPGAQGHELLGPILWVIVILASGLLAFYFLYQIFNIE